ncbi:MAG: NfeD family protein [Alphaproteobacteria bacterium]|nr:NfeD family protein [Alphaproteobacteria bacterium]
MFWYWLAAGALIAVLEIFVPGVVFLWLGIAAAVTGFIVLAAPGLSLEIQFLIFAALGLAIVYGGRRFARRHDVAEDHLDLNQGARRQIGRSAILETATVDGRGRARIGDSAWTVALRPGQPDLAAGAHVRIVDADGSLLIVEPSR